MLGVKSLDFTQNPMVDELNPQILNEWLAGMPLPERARILNRLAHDLTICTREFEAVTEPFKDPALVIKMLIGLSELQHQLTFFFSSAYDNASSASCWLRPGRNPYENPRKSSS